MRSKNLFIYLLPCRYSYLRGCTGCKSSEIGAVALRRFRRLRPISFFLAFLFRIHQGRSVPYRNQSSVPKGGYDGSVGSAPSLSFFPSFSVFSRPNGAERRLRPLRHTPSFLFSFLFQFIHDRSVPSQIFRTDR